MVPPTLFHRSAAGASPSNRSPSERETTLSPNVPCWYSPDIGCMATSSFRLNSLWKSILLGTESLNNILRQKQYVSFGNYVLFIKLSDKILIFRFVRRYRASMRFRFC